MYTEKYHKRDSTIKTESFGEIKRVFYNSLIKVRALKRAIDREILEYSLPIEVILNTTDEGFVEDYFNRELFTAKGITEEQYILESIKYLSVEKSIFDVDTIHIL